LVDIPILSLRSDTAPTPLWSTQPRSSITPGTYSHAIPAMQEAAAVLIAGLVFSAK